jgi:hypothetical protein
MKYGTDRSYADPEQAARKLLEIANSVGAVQDGHPHREDQRPVPVRRESHSGRIQGRPRSGDRPWLAAAA